MHIKLKNKKGQSTVEYVLLVTAVLAVIIVFVTGKNSGFQAQMNDTLNTVTSDIGSERDQLTASHEAKGVVGNSVVPYSVTVCPPGVTCTN